MDPHAKFARTDFEASPTDQPFRDIIGGLLYVATTTRPDISFSVSKLTQFLDCPAHTHFEADLKILRYLKGTQHLSLHYSSQQKLTLQLYVDADWAESDDRVSTTGYVIMLGGGVVAWGSKKQRLIALSSTESELIALTDAVKELVWVKKVLWEITSHAQFITIGDTILLEDNMSALQILKRRHLAGRTKHLDIRMKFCSKALENHVFEARHCATRHMVADCLTKPLPRVRFMTLQDYMLR
jgi:uncharacterized protein YlbG (UPF0298 family)